MEPTLPSTRQPNPALAGLVMLKRKETQEKIEALCFGPYSPSPVFLTCGHTYPKLTSNFYNQR